MPGNKKLVENLVYPELSFQIMGAIFDVYNSIGYGHREYMYQRALSKEFSLRRIGFTEQVLSTVSYKNIKIGKYYLDFLVENKIIVELKVRDYFSKNDIGQIFFYLKSENLKLGILTHFTNSGVRYKRIVNIN